MARTEDFDLGYTQRPKQRGNGIGWRTLVSVSLFSAGASAAAFKGPEIMDLVRSNFGSERAVATPVGATGEQRVAEIVPVVSAAPAEQLTVSEEARLRDRRLGVGVAIVRGHEVQTTSITPYGPMASDRSICNYYFGSNPGFYDIGVLSGNECITGEQADRLLEMGRESD